MSEFYASPGKPFTNVLIGPFSSKAEAFLAQLLIQSDLGREMDARRVSEYDEGEMADALANGSPSIVFSSIREWNDAGGSPRDNAFYDCIIQADIDPDELVNEGAPFVSAHRNDFLALLRAIHRR